MHPRNITLLRDLQVPESVLTAKIPVRSDTKGVYHSVTTHCYHAGVFLPAPPREVSLAETHVEEHCRCLNTDRIQGLNLWGLTSLVEDTVRTVLSPWVIRSPADMALHYRFLDNALRSFEAALFQVEVSFRETLAESIELVTGRIVAAREETLTELRSDHIRGYLAGQDASPVRSLVGLEGECFHYDSRTAKEDALLLAHELHANRSVTSGNSYRGLFPSPLARKVAHWADTVADRKEHYCDVVELTDSDTPEVVETALVLWDPYAPPSSPARFLADALEMARRL